MCINLWFLVVMKYCFFGFNYFCCFFLWVGSEGYILEEVKLINLFLIVLGKCINVFVENSFYVLICDLKLIRLFWDLFGGIVRMLLIVIIGLLFWYRGEIISIILFG